MRRRTKLDSLRKRIDKIDEKFIDLLAQRLELARDIAKIKKRAGKAILDEEREREVINRARKRATEKKIDPDFVESLLRLTISQTVGAEREQMGEAGMWVEVQRAFVGHPAQLNVAHLLLRYGLRVQENGEIACGNMRIPAVQVAKEAGVDRRVVDATARTILKNEKLKKIFSNLQPVMYLKGVAHQLKLGVVEILPVDATVPGIISEVSNTISKFGISIRQAIADDPYFVAQPKLTIITDKPLIGDVIEALRKLPSVRSVVVY
ncbi:MAG: chorismate mutase [Hadesarchaea archaeon]|nr:chorismate mutase [Hadesarchaea archaeon]